MSTTADLSSFDDFDMEGVADLPEFVLFPIGAHTVKTTMKLDVKDGKRSVKLSFTYVSPMELANPEDAVPNAGDMDSTMYFIDSDYGAGACKKSLSAIMQHFGTTNLRALSEQVIDLECVLVNKHRADKREGKQDNKYCDIVSLNVI